MQGLYGDVIPLFFTKNKEGVVLYVCAASAGKVNMLDDFASARLTWQPHLNPKDLHEKALVSC